MARLMIGNDSEIADLMEGLRAGERQSIGQLFEILYPELRRMAAARMKREGLGHSWQPTLLVNELYLELMRRKARPGHRPETADRSAFLGLAGFLMKRLLILHSRPLRQRVDHVNVEDWAEPSLAARLEASRLGIAIAAIMPMIATTMRSSINEKPAWPLFVFISFMVLLKRIKFQLFSRANGFFL